MEAFEALTFSRFLSRNFPIHTQNKTKQTKTFPNGLAFKLLSASGAKNITYIFIDRHAAVMVEQKETERTRRIERFRKKNRVNSCNCYRFEVNVGRI